MQVPARASSPCQESTLDLCLLRDWVFFKVVWCHPTCLNFFQPHTPAFTFTDYWDLQTSVTLGYYNIQDKKNKGDGAFFSLFTLICGTSSFFTLGLLYQTHIILQHCCLLVLSLISLVKMFLVEHYVLVFIMKAQYYLFSNFIFYASFRIFHLFSDCWLYLY